jgi:hypothetical protein
MSMLEPLGLDPVVELEPPQSLERRRHVRHLCNPRSILHLLVRPSFVCYRAFVHNASAGGLGLLLGHPLEAGSMLALQLQEAPHGVSCILLARVIHATPFPGAGWLIGCQLARPFPENDG